MWPDSGAAGAPAARERPRRHRQPTWRHRTPTDESELLELLAEKARQGNVAAIRVLLVREEERDRDPRARSLALLQEMAEARRQ